MTPAYSPASHYQSAPEAVYPQRSDRVFRTGGCETARLRQHPRQRALVEPYQPYQRSRAHECSLWMLTTAIGAHKASLAQQLRQLLIQLPVSGLCRPRSRNHHYVGLAHCLPQQLRSCRSQAPLDLVPGYCLANPFSYHKSHTNCARLPRPTHHCTQIPGPEPASLCKYPPEISLKVNPGDFAQLAPTVSAASPQNDRTSIAHHRPLSKRLWPYTTIENRDGITHLPLAHSLCRDVVVLAVCFSEGPNTEAPGTHAAGVGRRRSIRPTAVCRRLRRLPLPPAGGTASLPARPSRF